MNKICINLENNEDNQIKTNIIIEDLSKNNSYESYRIDLLNNNQSISEITEKTESKDLNFNMKTIIKLLNKKS